LEILNAGWRVSKLLFKILLAESYLLYMSSQPNELERVIKRKWGKGQTGVRTKIWGAMAHPSPPLRTTTIDRTLI